MSCYPHGYEPRQIFFNAHARTHTHTKAHTTSLWNSRAPELEFRGELILNKLFGID